MGESALAAKTPKTIGRPVMLVHSLPKSIRTNSGLIRADDSARSPIMSAPSHSSSIFSMSGPIGTSFGSKPLCPKIHFISMFDVEESEGRAMSRMDSRGLLPKRITDPTDSLPTIPMSGNRCRVLQLDA